MNLGPNKIFYKRRLKISYLLEYHFRRKKKNTQDLLVYYGRIHRKKCLMILE